VLERAGQRVVLAPPSAVRIFLFVLIGLNVLDHAQYVAQAYGNERGVSWKAHAADTNELLEWLQQHSDGRSAIAADNPALVYLRTGRPTVAMNSFDDPWSRWRRIGVGYVVSLSDGQVLDDPRRYKLRFKLEDKNLWVVELLTDTQTDVGR
jgi:hypothetical protein